MCHQSSFIELRSLGGSVIDLRLIHTFITGRSQAVTYQDRNPTDFENASSGVPRGSSPGPILILILINSLPQSIEILLTWLTLIR